MRSDGTAQSSRSGGQLTNTHRRILTVVLIGAAAAPVCALQKSGDQAGSRRNSKSPVAETEKSWWFPSDIRTGVEQRFDVTVSAKITKGKVTRQVEEKAHFSVELLPDAQGRPGCVVRLKPPDPADYAASEELAWFWILNLATANREGMRVTSDEVLVNDGAVFRGPWREGDRFTMGGFGLFMLLFAPPTHVEGFLHFEVAQANEDRARLQYDFWVGSARPEVRGKGELRFAKDLKGITSVQATWTRTHGDEKRDVKLRITRTAVRPVEQPGASPRGAAKGMQLPFKKVELMTRPALLVTYERHLKQMDVSRDAGLQRGLLIDAKQVNNATIAVRPDGTRFYIGADSGLLEFDGRGRLQRRIPTEQFDVGDRRFNWGAAASNERLWLTALGRGGNSAIVDWRPTDEPGSRIMVSAEAPIGVAVDRASRRVYLPLAGGVIDFNIGEFRQGEWGRFEFADSDPERGVLLSGPLAFQTDEIVRFDPRTNSRQVVGTGTYAVWGPDEWVYFCVGETQLWRCKTDGSRREPVFLATTNPVRRTEESYARPPTFDEKRTRLAWTCLVPFKVGRLGVTVLIDLKAREYRELPGQYHGNMAWVVRDD